MKFKLLIFILIFFQIQTGFGQLSDSIKIHIDSSLLILKQNSLYANKVDWEHLKLQVYDSAKIATTKAQTFTALKIAFNALDDKHAAYYQYEDEYKVENKLLLARYSDSIKFAWSRGPRIYSKMINNIAYINVPFIGVNKQTDIDKFANWIYNAVVELDKNNPKGWILDLRLNGGGNIRPMLAGLALFFHGGVVSYYIDRDGNATDESAFYNGDFTIAGVKQVTIDNKQSKRIDSKVAVLIGPGTASSGEGVAAVFHERKKTKIFGENSAGLANSTQGFVFNDNNSYFLISTAYLGNSKKKVLPEFIKPDIIVKGNDAFTDITKDTVVKSAIKWLENK